MGANGSGEKELAKRLRKGDSRAMKETYDRYVGGLTSLCSRYVADAEDVKDILQECFVKIFGSIDSFEYLGEGSLNAWMSRIVVNRAISFVRNYESFESLDILSDIPVVEDDDPPPQLDDISPGIVLEMIQSLPAGCRTVLNLAVFEGKSHKEIASMLGIRESSSASQLSRARRLLVNKVKQYKTSQQNE